MMEKITCEYAGNLQDLCDQSMGRQLKRQANPKPTRSPRERT